MCYIQERLISLCQRKGERPTGWAYLGLSDGPGGGEGGVRRGVFLVPLRTLRKSNDSWINVSEKRGRLGSAETEFALKAVAG